MNFLITFFSGYRVPFTIISPWTRGGHVFTEHADHNSQIMFVETWLEALGYKGVVTDQMPAWRRAHMSNLVNAFDFDNVSFHPDKELLHIQQHQCSD
jgi:phospholipase C